MKTLSRLAARFGSPHPVAYRFVPAFSFGLTALFGALALCMCCLLVSAAYAQGAASAPVVDPGGYVSLWGPFLGVVSSLVLFFDRLAKVIPNSTTSTILGGIRVVATVLGAKVQDRQ